MARYCSAILSKGEGGLLLLLLPNLISGRNLQFFSSFLLLLLSFSLSPQKSRPLFRCRSSAGTMHFWRQLFRGCVHATSWVSAGRTTAAATATTATTTTTTSAQEEEEVEERRSQKGEEGKAPNKKEKSDQPSWCQTKDDAVAAAEQRNKRGGEKKVWRRRRRRCGRSHC